MLLKCVECGRDIYDESRECNHCGCPIEETIKTWKIESPKESEQNIKGYRIKILHYEDRFLENFTKLKEILGIETKELHELLEKLPCFLPEIFEAEKALEIAKKLEKLPIKYEIYKEVVILKNEDVQKKEDESTQEINDSNEASLPKNTKKIGIVLTKKRKCQ